MIAQSSTVCKVSEEELNKDFGYIFKVFIVNF